MEKLIITVACDSRTSYPINHYCPPQDDIEGVATQYIDGIKAGAAIAHIHGIRTLEESMQADGKQVSRINPTAGSGFRTQSCQRAIRSCNLASPAPGLRKRSS
jgi:hypothetical protein